MILETIQLFFNTENKFENIDIEKMNQIEDNITKKLNLNKHDVMIDSDGDFIYIVVSISPHSIFDSNYIDYIKITIENELNY